MTTNFKYERITWTLFCHELITPSSDRASHIWSTYCHRCILLILHCIFHHSGRFMRCGHKNVGINNVFFPQNGATCHAASPDCLTVARNVYLRVMPGNGDTNWTPWSCNFFLWVYEESQVYEFEPRNISDPWQNITSSIDNLSTLRMTTRFKNS